MKWLVSFVISLFAAVISDFILPHGFWDARFGLYIWGTFMGAVVSQIITHDL